MPLSFTVETTTTQMTTTEFKDKHGGWPIVAINPTRATLPNITRQYTKTIQENYPHLSVTAIHRSFDKLFFVLHGASSLEYQRFTTRTCDPLLTFQSGHTLRNFVPVYENYLIKLDEMMSPPAYTEQPQQPQQEPKDALAAAWKEIEDAKKQLEEDKKQFEEQQIKMKLLAKIMLFDEEIAKFKQQFFTQDELVSIRKTIDERF